MAGEPVEVAMAAAKAVEEAMVAVIAAAVRV
jgi:hypothetical protein